MSEVIATRAAGLRILRDFAPRMGQAYAQGRNFDRGPGRHYSVSGLSPYLRRRLVGEWEAVAAALTAHGPAAAAKFVDEVFWRGYFKGWLERRPQIWNAYAAGLRADVAAHAGDEALARAFAGQTGLACFDAWARELVATGYLHNHARMWFASIWIFTLRLPWRLGADFFLRHLLDGDPASNTLSWRWVAGLHTRGKHYVARADNIATFTEGRFAPAPSDLANPAHGLEAEEPGGLPPPCELRVPAAPRAGVPTALLLTEEDCAPDSFPWDGLDIRAAATLAASHLRSPLPVASPVGDFEAGALADAAARSGFVCARLRAGDPADLAAWAAGAGAAQIVTAYVPCGPLRDWFEAAIPSLAARGIAWTERRRDWDAAIWPHATAGFFQVKRQIPEILRRMESS